MPRIEIENDDPNKIPIIADAIIKISTTMEDLLKQGLTERAIIALTIDLCPACIGSGYTKRKPSRKELTAIFRTLELLQQEYIYKKRSN